MSSVLHVIAARLKPGAGAAAVAGARRLARAMRDAPGVEDVVVAQSAERMIVASWLSDAAALEPFAASPEHMSFVMRGLAPVIDGMWSAAVSTPAPPPAEPGALWAFALGAPATLYEWQVRDLLAQVERLPGHAATGPTIEERERYRAGGVVSLAWHEVGAFEAELARVRGGWSVADDIVDAAAPVVPPGDDA